MRARTGLAGAVGLLLLACGAAAQDAPLSLGPGQAAIVFIVGGDAINGEILAREKSRGAIAWSTLIGQNAVRRFAVRPGVYPVQLDPTAQTATIEAKPGALTVVALAGVARDGGSFAVVRQSQVLPANVEGSDLGTFLADHPASERALAAVSLEHLGADLVFVVRPQF